MTEDKPRPESTVAILLGAGSWPQYVELEGGNHFAGSHRRFREYLAQPKGLNLADENVCDLFDDARSPSELVVAVAEFLENHRQRLAKSALRIRDLLFYFVGHAEYDDPTQLYHLIVRYTRENLWAQTSLRIVDLYKAFEAHTPTARRYIIIDACYAGRAGDFIYQSSGSASVGKRELDEFADKGAALLSSSGSTSRSKAPADSDCTMFTGALLEALMPSTRPRSRSLLSLHEVRNRTVEVLEQRYGRMRAVWPEVHSPSQGQKAVADSPILPVVSPSKRNAPTRGTKTEPQRAPSTVAPSTEKSPDLAATQTVPKTEISKKADESASANTSTSKPASAATAGVAPSLPLPPVKPYRSISPRATAGGSGGGALLVVIYMAFRFWTPATDFLKAKGWISGEPSTQKLQLDIEALRKKNTPAVKLDDVLGAKGLATRLIESSAKSGTGVGGTLTQPDTLGISPSNPPILHQKPVDLSKLFAPSSSRLGTDPSKPASPWLPTQSPSPLRNSLRFPDYLTYPTPAPVPAPATTSPPAGQKPETKP